MDDLVKGARGTSVHDGRSSVSASWRSVRAISSSGWMVDDTVSRCGSRQFPSHPKLVIQAPTC